jgi:hypothetical protein
MSDNILQVVQYHPYNIQVRYETRGQNPFYTEIFGIFEGPDGQKLKIPGFYNGDNTFIVRVSCNKKGRWKYYIKSGDAGVLIEKGEIKCIPNTNPNIHGGLKVDPKHPYHFQYEDGTDYFMMAYECDWLFALGLGDPNIQKVRELCHLIKKYGFNSIIFNIYAHDTPWAEGKTCENDYGPPAEFLWGGTNENPDHSRMNLVFFENLDKTMELLFEQGITAHVFFKVYNKGVSWPCKYSKEEDLYFKYIVSRYAAFPNIIWDFAKEAFHESDKEYIVDRLRLIRKYDAYNRLLTIHDDRLFYSNPEYSKHIDFFTAQQHVELNATALLERKNKKWPVFNSELGYDLMAGYKPLIKSNHTSEEFIKRAYKVVMAGAYIAYYNHYTAWDIIDYSKITKGYEYCKILYDFFTSINWKELEPHNELCLWSDKYCLANPGKEYVFFFERLVIVNIDLSASKYNAEWINIFTGERIKNYIPEQITDPEPQKQYRFTSPFGDMPVLLHLTII